MKLTEEQQLIMDGKVCPYCRKEPELLDSSMIYGTSYGLAYWCRPCDAYVGCHEGTDKALGRLANKDLRICKKAAHEAFDKIWRSKKMTRPEAYEWLSKALGISPEHTHIGMFGIKTCNDVVRLSVKKMYL